MIDQRSDDEIDDVSDDADHPSEAPEGDDERRSDIEQAVEARSDAIDRGEGGPEPETFTAPGMRDGVGGTGGVAKNQDDDAQ